MVQLGILFVWSVFIIWVVYTTTSSDKFFNQSVGQMPINIHFREVDLGFRCLQKVPTHKYQIIFKPFIRKINCLFIDGSGEMVNEIILAKQVTQVIFGVPIIVVVSFITPQTALLSIIVLSLLVFNERYHIEQKYVRKQKNMSEQLSNVLFQFVLLISAGQTVMDAFEKVAYTQEGELYKEMAYCVQNIAYGMPQIEALSKMASRCDDTDIKRMVNLLMQTQQKGSSELSRLFFDMSQANWAKKKTRLLQNAKNAATQLLLPSGIIFLGIIIMMMLPLLANGFLM